MTTYYVSQDGDNTTGLSLATAKTTVAAGCALLSAGDLLLIDDGIYHNEPIDDAIPDGISDGQRTIVRAINPLLASFTFDNFGTMTPQFWAVEIENRQFITIDGLKITVPNSNGCIQIGTDAGGGGGSGSSYITVQNCELIGGDTGLANKGGASINHHLSYINNIIHGQGNTSPTFQGFDPHCIYPVCHDSLIEGNECYNCGNATDGGAAIHQYTGESPACDNNVYRRNFLHDNYGAGILVSNGNDDLVYNNIVVRNNIKVEGGGAIDVGWVNGLGIYNNTVYDNNDMGISLSASAVDTVVKNNISYQNGVSDYSDLGSGTIEDHNLFGTDPDFINPGSDDYHLQDTSPAIDAGVDLSAIFAVDYDGNPRG